MAIAAFAAFVIAPVASAATLTENGVAVKVGEKLIATNTGVTKFTGSVIVTCSTAHLTGELKENTNGHIKGEVLAANAKFTGTGTSGDCTTSLSGTSARVEVNRNLCLTISKGSDTIVTDACGARIQFTLELTGLEKCKYEQEELSISSTFETNVSPVSTTLTEKGKSKLISGSEFFCPKTGTLDMTFDLYTDVAEDTKFPLTIS
ncbi:MAG TPA: hypothetical protein VNN15_00585 [Solirubrobacterales bacterium]|nr:hypothetical protein [Solirubrobacterales bacterium]